MSITRHPNVPIDINAGRGFFQASSASIQA